MQINILNHDVNTKPIVGVSLIVTMFLSLFAAMIICALLAMLVELVAYRRLRLRGSSRLASLISAIGTSIFLSEGLRILTHSRPQTAPRLLEKTSLGNIWGANLRIDIIITILASITIFILIDQFVNRSRLGKAIRAVSMSEENSRLMGINLSKVITLTFAIGGLTTGAAAFFYTTVYENTIFNVGFNLGIAAFTAAVLGGIGNIRGAFYGGIFLGLLEQFASAILGSQWKAVTVFVVLVLVLLVRPSGIFGEAVQQTRT